MERMVVIGVLVAVVLAILLARSRSDQRVSMPGAAPFDAGTASVEELMLAGRKIDAIKRYREEHGVGLKEAKEAVEAIHPAR